MRHKYRTQGIVLSRTPLGESSALVALLTPDLGLLYARAQGVRQPGAKLAAALATLSESDTVLVRGRESWRITGAVLENNWCATLPGSSSVTRVARVSGLMQRLSAHETSDRALFGIFKDLLEALVEAPQELAEAAEILASLRALGVLGFDSGELPKLEKVPYLEALRLIEEDRATYIARINRGISASGL